MESNKNENKRSMFKSALVIGAVGLATAGIGGAIVDTYIKNQPIDLSKYNIDNDKYEEYVKDEDNKQRMLELDENIRIYNKLAKETDLTESQKLALEKATDSIKEEMKDGMIANVYLNDILKGKLKEAYGKDAEDGIEVKSTNTPEDGKRIIIIMYDRLRNKTSLQVENIKEIRTAVGDIINMKDNKGKGEYTDKDVEDFTKAYENMKGFSNLQIIKAKDGKIAVMEIGDEGR